MGRGGWLLHFSDWLWGQGRVRYGEAAVFLHSLQGQHCMMISLRRFCATLPVSKQASPPWCGGLVLLIRPSELLSWIFRSASGRTQSGADLDWLPAIGSQGKPSQTSAPPSCRVMASPNREYCTRAGHRFNPQHLQLKGPQVEGAEKHLCLRV